jgi:glycerophosphoryl diester phosphodiesterase
MSSTVFTAICGLREHWRAVLCIHTLFTLMGISVLTPLFGASVRAAVSLSGSAALADQEIASLLLSPTGFVAGLMLLSVLLAITGLEIAAMQVVAHVARNRGAATALRATVWSMRHSGMIVRLTLQLVLRALVYIVPYLVVVAAIAWLLLTDYDINYYLSERPGSFIAALSLSAGATALLLWLLGRRLVGWCLALPLVLTRDALPAAAFGMSEQLTADLRGHCARTLTGWLALALATNAIPALFLTLSTDTIISLQIESLQFLVILLGSVGLLWALLGFMINAYIIGLLAFSIEALHCTAAGSTRLNERLLSELGSAPRPRPLLLAAATITLTAVSVAGTVTLLGDITVADRTVVIAHRGAAGSAPENTLSAVRQAVADGADWIEIDVQETRDGKVVVMHDSDFMKLAANPMKVWEGDLADIQQIDVGSWFGAAYATERVPTLAQVLEEVRDKVPLVIELKYYGHDQDLERRVIELVEEQKMSDQVVVMSLKLAGIKRVQALRPKWTTGLLAATAVGDLSKLDVDFLAVSTSLASPAFIKRAQANGKQVYVWTVNDGLSLSRWMSFGVDGVITDEPALARDILQQRSQLSAGERLLLSISTLFGTPELARQYRDNSP